MRGFPLYLLLALTVSGCTHRGISSESINLVNRSISYQILRENPDNFIGTYVHLGGIIAKVSNHPDGGELEVVDLPLGSSGTPKMDAQSGGRYLARSNRFLDPLIFRPGTPVSLVGEVKGHRVARLDNVQYRYPVISIREVHPWQPEEEYRDTRPRFNFGIGFMHGF